MSKPDNRDFEERYDACFKDLGLKVGKTILLFTTSSMFFISGLIILCFGMRYIITTAYNRFGTKLGSGLLIGSMMGSFFLRGYKKWPMYIGGGLGFGMAYTNCENSLNSFLLSLDPKACQIKKQP